MDWQSSNLAETFKLFKQQLELFFIVNKIKTEQQVNYILLRVGNEGLKKYDTWLLTEEEKCTPEIILNKFIEQLEPKENFRINCLFKQFILKFSLGSSCSMNLLRII